jgi:hypothetical protein
MKTTLRFGLSGQIARLLLLLSCLAVSQGRLTVSAAMPPDVSAPQAKPYHSIVGDRGRGDTPNSSDGAVAYWSSHLTGAKSELIVPGPHGSFALTQTVSELKRILLLNLAAGDALHGNVIPQRQDSAAGPDSKRPDTVMAEHRGE